MAHNPAHLRKMLVASLMTSDSRTKPSLPKLSSLGGLIRVGELLNQRLEARKESPHAVKK